MGARPASAEEVAEAVRAHPRVAAVGGRTKANLIGAGEPVELAGLSGITEYESSEYTFTARAGTPVAEVREALRAKGQALPFDPSLADDGATLGGTVASGISGPGRFRYGGLRDFLIGVQFVDGAGKLVRSGGKVVKNAAGFDFPKLLVGSLGRLAILTELTFKVFPEPPARRTIRIHCEAAEEAVTRLVRLANSRWEPEALDWNPAHSAVHLRLAGPAPAIEALAKEIVAEWPDDARMLAEEGDADYWAETVRSRFEGESGTVVKVPTAPSQIVALDERLAAGGNVDRCYDSGGAVAWLKAPSGGYAAIDEILDGLSHCGLVVKGAENAPLWLGRREESAIDADLKLAFDPEDRFPKF